MIWFSSSYLQELIVGRPEGEPCSTRPNHLTPSGYIPLMSSWEDHQEMIDDQYLMESIEEDQKLDNDEEVLKDEE